MKTVIEFSFPDSNNASKKTLEDLLSNIQGIEVKVLSSIPSGEITFEVIEKEVCSYTGISKEFLQNAPRNNREVVEARQLCHHISKNLHLGTLSSIGFRFGKKDHATVLHSNKTVLNLLQTNTEYRNQYKSFIESFK